MKRRLLASCLLPIVLAAGGLTVGPAAVSAAAPTTPLKVMVNGDSITQQYNGDYTWRYRLVKEVVRQGRRVDFVGPNKWPYGGSKYYRVSGWDYDHDAIGGSRLYQHLVGGPYDITTQLTRFHPDVLISFLGSNDLLDAVKKLDNDKSLTDEQRTERLPGMIQQVVDDYATFVDQARSIDPSIKIVLAEVMTHQLPPYVRTTYNAALAAQVVNAKSEPSSSIVLTPLNAASDASKWNPGNFTYDLIHPTPTGEMVVAQRFAQALHSIAPEVLPDPPAIPQVAVAWNPVLVAHLRVASKRIYVNCTETMRRSGVLGLRVRMTTVRNHRSVVSAFTDHTGWYSQRLAPGYYRIQVQGLRVTMTTPWSKTYTIKVPAPRKKKKRH